VYIPKEDILVIFGGQTNQKISNSIHYFHIRNETWEHILPAGRPSIGLVFPSVVYDQAHHRLVYLVTLETKTKTKTKTKPQLAFN